MRPNEVIEICITAHGEFIAAASQLSESDVRAPSRLEGWSRAHLLTHLARNADSLTWLFEGATNGESREQYPVPGMREADIEAGSTRSKDELIKDLTDSCRRLENAWAEFPEELWDSFQTVGVGQRTMSEIAFRRLREVEVHHLDLDVGYAASSWPAFYVEEELRRQIDQLHYRADHVALIEWLMGRGEVPTLGPWR
jgi:maleylpyruvate isomerase